MTKLEKLIEELCPNGVEYKKLGDIIHSLNTGLNPRQFFKLNTDDAENYYITIREIKNGNIIPNDKTDRINDEALRLCNNRSNLEQGDVLFSGTGTIGETALVEVTPTNWNIKEGVYAIKPISDIILSKFLMYLLNADGIRIQYMKKAAGGTVKSVPMKEMKNIVVPVPPLEVQSEIVRILDNFTELTAELNEKLDAELTARKKQYEYYRNAILTENQNYITTLGDACDFVRGPFGGSLKKEIFQKSGYAVYEQQHAIYGDFTFRYYIDEEKYLSMQRFAVNAGDMIMSCSGTMGKIAIIPENAPKGIINQALLKLTAKDGVYNKYLKHCFENTVAAQMNTAARGGAIKNVASVAELKNIKINLPPFEEQKRIVDLLDRFDTLCNDISAGLPAEIEARQKQYEYYRDKLLSFKSLSLNE